MEDKRQSHTRQAFIHMLIIVCICLNFIREVQQLKSLVEPVADSALSKRHFPFRNALEVVARLPQPTACVSDQLATENPSVSILLYNYNSTVQYLPGLLDLS